MVAMLRTDLIPLVVWAIVAYTCVYFSRDYTISTISSQYKPPKHHRSAYLSSEPWNLSYIVPDIDQFRSPYHKHYNVNCSAVFQGNESEIEKIAVMLRPKYHKNKADVLPSNLEVSTTWVNNCSLYKHLRKYPTQASSREEHAFPIAYSIMVYKHAAQVERLLMAIYQPQNVYCIHIDNKSDPMFINATRKLAECFNNVFIASRLESVQWGGFSVSLADLHCMDDLLHHQVQWKYLINLCGQDFPLKTNLEIIRRLKKSKGTNCIPAGDPADGGKWSSRTRYKYHSPSLSSAPVLVIPRRKKAPPPGNITIYKGSFKMAATRGFIEYLVNDDLSKQFLNWLQDTMIPDETFVPSLSRRPQVPGYSNNSKGCSVHLQIWKDQVNKPACRGKYLREICICNSGYLQFLQKMPYLFVNKFHYDYDPVTMQCMEELLALQQRSN